MSSIIPPSAVLRADRTRYLPIYHLYIQPPEAVRLKDGDQSGSFAVTDRTPHFSYVIPIHRPGFAQHCALRTAGWTTCGAVSLRCPADARNSLVGIDTFYIHLFPVIDERLASKSVEPISPSALELDDESLALLLGSGWETFSGDSPRKFDRAPYGFLFGVAAFDIGVLDAGSPGISTSRLPSSSMTHRLGCICPDVKVGLVLESRRDDIEAFSHTLPFLLSDRLPWQGIYAPGIDEKKNRIREMKTMPPRTAQMSLIGIRALIRAHFCRDGVKFSPSWRWM
ncbi:hypothetical protein FISHEDRAFT_61580 [Fistulina hepatica ATCC 64428]|uniref:Uncharacterized protein n=1 Tax=Fistulina hepatica ATCC 64428 TaxID=1128425 RepID=A0A0D7A4S3_9AGAR|nr:hypothetical protein FISHEDRAFT_61580 [Fistulina hepatica ATCC 64428]